MCVPHSATLSWKGLLRSRYLIIVSENIASRCYARQIPHLHRRVHCHPSLLWVSLYHSCKCFPSRSKPSEWVCGVQIAWDFVLFWLIFVRGNHTEHNKTDQTLGPWHICKMLGEGAWGSELGQTLSHCEHHPSHLQLGSCGQVTSFSNISVTSFVH